MPIYSTTNMTKHKLYQQYIAKTPNNQAAQKIIIKDDFAYFQKIGFDKMLITKATTDLKL
ncbi:MAG: hypothetical protein IPF62_12290 [Bacteroidetes bacterium]|nr:hypothetical protein [Bacteroidota bacterium]